MMWIVERNENGVWVKHANVNAWNQKEAMTQAISVLKTPPDQLHNLRVRPVDSGPDWKPAVAT